MEGNLALRTPRGLRFFNCNREEVQVLIDKTARLKLQRNDKHHYRLVVTIEGIGDVEADDIWLAVGAECGS